MNKWFAEVKTVEELRKALFFYSNLKKEVVCYVLFSRAGSRGILSLLS